MAKIVGTFCERIENPKRLFDPRSLRYKFSGKGVVLIGCPKGQYDPAGRGGQGGCRVGTRAYKVLSPARGRCRVGRRITKR